MKTKVSEPAGMICQLEFKTTKVKIIHGIFFAVMMLLCAICLLPVIWMFLSAFKDTKEFLKIPPSFLPEPIDFSKVVDTWTQNNIGRRHFVYHRVQRSCRICHIETETARFQIVFYANHVDNDAAEQCESGTAVYDVYRLSGDALEFV